MNTLIVRTLLRLSSLALAGSLFLLLIIAPQPVLAHDVNDWFGLAFGDPPTEDMLCLSGDCSNQSRSASGLTTRSILQTYQRQMDYTHLGTVAITAPLYDFYEGQLLRIKFHLNCPAPAMDRCLQALPTALDDAFGLIPLETREGAPEPFGLYQTNSGKVVTIRSISSEHNERPREDVLVHIFDHNFMEQVRSEMNPYYIPQPLPTPYSNISF